MKKNNVNRHAVTLLGAGLFIENFPFIFGEYYPLNDFLNGFCKGLGLTLIIFGIIKIYKSQKRIYTKS